MDPKMDQDGGAGARANPAGAVLKALNISQSRIPQGIVVLSIDVPESLQKTYKNTHVQNQNTSNAC